MSILELKEVFEKRGTEFIEKLFKSEITVYEKLDGNSFGFYKANDGRLKYFKKNDKQDISLIDRTVSNLYENPIGYFDNLDKEIVKQIPENFKFGFEFFPKQEESGYPKNNLVLSYIEDGSSKIEDRTSLDYWADLLDVERTSIVFNGYLSEEQKTAMLEFVYTPYEEIKNKYQTESIVIYLINLLNPNISLEKLNTNKDRTEGVIIKFKIDNTNYYAKVIDPTFTEVMTNRETADESKSYNYYIILYDILEFVRISNMDLYNVIGEDYDSKYINLMSKLYNDFCQKKGEQYLEVDFALPEYLKPFQFKINKAFITDPTTLKWLDKSENYVELFKIFLTSFRKKRKRENFMFDSKINSYFNKVVDDIKVKLSSSINESFMTFPQFDKIYIQGEDSTDVLGYDIEDFLPMYKEQPMYKKDLDFNFEKFFSQVFVTTAKVEAPKKKKKQEAKEEVMLFLDIFSPINNRHFEYIKQVHERTGKRFVLVHIEFPFKNKWTLVSKNIVDKSLGSIAMDFSAFVKGYVSTDDYILKDIFPTVFEESQIVGICTSNQFYDIVAKQLQNNKSKNNYLEIEDTERFELNLYEEDPALKNKIATAIANNDFNNFKTKVPIVVANLFNQIHSERTSGLEV